MPVWHLEYFDEYLSNLGLSIAFESLSRALAIPPANSLVLARGGH
jgi:hypothetical protein